MLPLFLAGLLRSALAAGLPFCQEISTDASSFGQVYKIQTQVAEMSTGLHCRGDKGERISGFPADPADFLAQCGNNLFAGETCYTGSQDEALDLLKSLGEKGAVGADYSLTDVKKSGSQIVYSIKNKKGRVDPRLDQLSSGRCTQSSFAP
jgi:hypothetical protein